MSTRNSDGNTFLYWVPTINRLGHPKKAELRAGLKISQDAMTSEVFTKSESRNTYEDGNAEDEFVATRVGTYQVSEISSTVKDNGNVNWFEEISYGETGFVVRSTRGNAIRHGTQVEVYPAEAHLPETLQTASNEQPKIMLRWAVTAAPVLNAVVQE